MRHRAPVLAALLGAAALVAALVPDAVLAHAVSGGREDLPIPREFFVWGATIVLVASFLGLATLWPTPRLEQARERVVLALPRVLEVLAGAIGVALFGFLVWTGYAGTQSVEANLLPNVVYVVFWVGLAVVSAFFGDVFAAFNPWRAIGRATGWVAGRVRSGDVPEPMPYPERLGRWPATVLILAFAWLELAYADNQDPSLLATLMLAYAAIQLVGMALFGVEAWSRHGDGFGVYFGLFARLSPLHWHDRRLGLRVPLAGLTELRALPGTVALLAVMIGSTSFDGFREGEIWTDWLLEIQGWLTDLGLSAARALEVASTLGLLGMIGLILGLYRLGVAGMRTVEDELDSTELARGFVHSLVPIAFAYVLAHYFSLLAFQLQATWYLISDPLGRGWDVFGTAATEIDYTVVSTNGIWYVQVAALVIGHVAGLMLAHDRALVLFKEPRTATRSQYWMLAVMIAFTSLGLWLLSSSNG